MILIPLVALQNNADLKLGDAIERALKHSVDVRLAADQVRQASSATAAQWSRLRPNLAASASATQFDNKTRMAFAGSEFEVLGNHQESLGIELSQVIDISNQATTAISQAKLNELSARYGLDATRQNVTLSATTTFFNLLRAEQAIKVAESSLTAYQEQLKTTTRLFDGGVGLKLDVLRAKSQVADAERELVRRTNQRNSTRSALNDLVGNSLDTPLALQAPAEWSTLDPSDREKLISQALDQRSEFRAAKVQTLAAQKGIKLARSGNEPSLSVSLGGNYYPTTSFQVPRQSNVALTLMLSIPIYDGGLTKARLDEAHTTVDSAKTQEESVRRQIALSVQNASLDVETAKRQLEAAQVAVEAARAARKLAQERFDAQVSLYIEITDAQAALTSAETAKVDAEYDLVIAQARLARALGTPIH